MSRQSVQRFDLQTAPVKRGTLLAALFLLIGCPLLLNFRDARLDDKQRLTGGAKGTAPSLAMHQPGVYRGKPWKTERTISTKVLGETPFARCDVHSVRSTDGSNIVRDWIFMEERDAINVAVLTADGKFLVFEQEKYAIHGKTLSPVGGFVNNGESPFDAARREVIEELGVGSKQTLGILKTKRGSLQADEKEDNPFGDDSTSDVQLDNYGEKDGSIPNTEPDWVFLGVYRTAANRGGGFLYSYLLVDAVPVADGGGTDKYVGTGDAEPQKLLALSLDELSDAVVKGSFKEIKWAATLSLSLLHLQSRNKNPS